MGLIHRLQSKFEIYRLQRRYTNRRKRRTAATYATSEAIYVNGEYIYHHHHHQQPTTTEEEEIYSEAERKANQRISRLIGCIGEETVRAERQKVREKEREREREREWKRRVAAANAAAGVGTGRSVIRGAFWGR